ncbi:MAG: SpoIIE family protein phosphatase [Ruminococcus sp.]|nr:SpoIIE family protein phosphatase [Ruminococcus sp.]
MRNQSSFTVEKTDHSAIAICIAVSLTALLASAGNVGGRASLINVGLSAVFPESAIPVFLASGVYYAISGSFSRGIVPLSAMLLIGLFRYMVRRFTSIRSFYDREPLLNAASSALIGGLLSLVYSSAVGMSGGAAMAGVLSALMLGVFVYAFSLLAAQYSERGSFASTGAELFCMAAVYICLISALAGAKIFFIDIGRALACAVLLLAARKRGSVWGAAFGALTTCAMLIGAPSLAGNTFLLAAVGLICGAFSQLGTLAVALAFLFSAAAGLVTSGVGPDTFYMFGDAAIGAVAFALIPEKLARRFSALVFGSSGVYSALSSTTASRLSFVSHTLSDIRKEIVLVNSALERKIKAPSPADRAWDELCSRCSKKGGCSPNEKQHRARLSQLAEAAEHFGEIASCEAAAAFPACTKPELLSDSFNYSAAALSEFRAGRVRSSQLRSLLCEQLVTMEDLLGDLSYRVDGLRSVDPALSAKVAGYFSSLGYNNVRACAYLDHCGYRRVDVYLLCAFHGDAAEAAVAVSDITDTDLELPVISMSGGAARIVFHERTLYGLDYATYTAAGTASPVSGDVIEVIDLPSGDVCAVLADGMGTGPRARLDSVFAADLAGRLMTAGVSMRTALRLVNSALLTKNAEESFAAVDVLTFDLFSGTAELLKAGAAPTYLLRDGVLTAFGDRSFPVGILDSCPPDTYSCKLFDGDIIILSSDGAERSAVSAAAELENISELSTKEIATVIGESAMKNYSSKTSKSTSSQPPRDDISVAVFRVKLKKTPF